MKKFFIIVLILLAGAAYYVYQDPELRGYFDKHTQELLPEQATHTIMYRWRDAQGQWQVSDKPPPAGTDYETVRYHKDTNVIPAERLTGEPRD